MDLGIKGRTALVTASSTGMGRNIAHALAAEGVNLVLFARSAETLRGVAHEIAETHGVKSLAVPGDMLVRADVERLTATLQHDCGGPDIVVLNTARPPNPIRATLDESDAQRWHEAYHNQLWAVIQVANSVIPLMLARGWGRIIAITSASVKEPMPHHSLSTVFRAGVTAYMKHLANEVGANGITVNCVAPALIETPHRSAAAAYSAAQLEARRNLAPLRRLGTQAEVCGVVAFLASMQAGFVTGSTINVEGGMLHAMV